MDQLQPRFNPSKKVTLVGQTDVGGNLFITSYKKEPGSDITESAIPYQQAATRLKDKDAFPSDNPFDDVISEQAPVPEPVPVPGPEPVPVPVPEPVPVPVPEPVPVPVPEPEPATVPATPEQIVAAKTAAAQREKARREEARRRATDRIIASSRKPLPLPPTQQPGGKSRRNKKTGKKQKGRKSRKQRK